MTRCRIAVSMICLVGTVISASAQERTAMRVSIGEILLAADVQPRVVVEQQLNAFDQARIHISGPLAIAYANTITEGDDVDIIALRLDGSSIPIFNGEVLSLEQGLDHVQPFVVIHASSFLPRVETPPDRSSVMTPEPGGDARLLTFLPRLSATSSIQEVFVTGVDASTGAPITGHAIAPTILLGSGSVEAFGDQIRIETDRRFSSAAEADAFAGNVLADLLAHRISAEALTNGTPDIKVGLRVEIEGVGTRFDGAYYVAGVKHQFGSDAYGGYSSAFRLRREDLGMFRIPALDDETLVAFEHGDLSRPYSTGSFWDCDSRRSDDSEQCRLLRWPW